MLKGSHLHSPELFDKNGFILESDERVGKVRVKVG